MKPTHYHITLTFSAVTLHTYKGIVWTSDGYKADSIDLRPLEELMGREVTRVGWTGKIVEFLTDERRFVDGEYLSSGRYAMKKRLEFMNAQVGVHWYNNSNLKDCPLLPYWNNFHNLQIKTT